MVGRAPDQEALQAILKWWAILPRIDNLVPLISTGLEGAIREVRASASLLWGFDGHSLHLIACQGTSANLFHPGKLHLGEGLSGRSIAESRALVSENIENDERMGLRDSGYRRVFHSVIAIPLALGNKPCGVVTVLDKRRRGFTDEDVSALRYLGQRLALSLHQCSLFPELAGDWLDQLRFESRSLETRRYGSAPSQLPKGISHVTLMAICSAMGDNPGCGTCVDLAGITGLSETTLRHYLSYMAEAGIVVRSPSYGRPGRPEYRYDLAQRALK